MNSQTVNQSLSISINYYTWRRSLLALIFCILIILFFYSKTISQMVSLWSVSDTYAHGFIVPFISLWLIWRIRKKWMKLKPEKSWTALFIMTGTAGLWLAGDLVAVNAVTQLALVSMIILCIPALFGWPIASAMTFPLMFLFFSVPIGDFMLPIMMEWTANFTVIALKYTGIPVYREGLQFIIPSGSWSVVEACSGIRYLIASVTVGCLFAYINYTNKIKRLVFIIFSIGVPLIANWLRAYLIVLIGHYSGNELATGVDHLIYGWIFFGLVISLMLFIGSRWADDPVFLNSSSEFSKINNLPITFELGKDNYKYKFAGIIAFIIIVPHISESWITLKNRKLPVHLENIVSITPWRQLEDAPSEWKPGFLHAAEQSNTGFENNIGSKVGLHISYYRQQNYKSKLVTSTNDLIPNNSKEWVRVSRQNKKVNFGNKLIQIDDSILRHKKIIGDSKNEYLHIWNFYWVNDKLTANNIYAKIQGALGRITGNGDDGAIIAIYVPYNPSESVLNDVQSTSEVLQNFINIHENSIISSLQKTRDKN